MQIKLLLVLMIIIGVILIFSFRAEKNIKKIDEFLEEKLSGRSYTVLCVIIFVGCCVMLFAINLIALAMVHL